MRPKRQKVWLAILGSVLLHGVALAIFALIVAFRPPETPVALPEETLKLEIAQDDPPETPPPFPDAGPTPTPTPAAPPKLLVDAAGPDADSPPPADAPLSDRSTRASSVDPSGGVPPGTTQAGHRMVSYQFDPRPPAPGAASRVEATPPPETAPELPKPDRSVSRPARTKDTSPPETTPAPTADPNEFAMAMATPPPPPEDPFDPSVRSTSPPLPKPAARPTEKSTPPPSVGAIRSAENGSSAVRGAGGIDTQATPASRYTHNVTDTIKYVWGRSIKRREDLPYGTAVIHCTIDKDGLAIGPRIVSNTSDVVFGSIALQAVVVARLPPMPADVARELDGKLGLDITFDLTPLPQEAALR